MAITVRGDGPQAAINVTPMIDVLLVLLIIFMAVTPVRQTGLDALVPQSGYPDQPEPSENPMVLSIARDGSYALNSERVDADRLSGRLREIFLRRGQRVLFLKAAGELEFQSVAAAIDMTREAGVPTVALMPRD